MSVKFFGQFLLERGKIIKEELLDAMKFQKNSNVKLGTLAIDAGYLTAKQVEKIHGEQQQTDKLFGEICIDLGFLTSNQLEDLLMIQKNEHITLGDALVQIGYLNLSDLEQELALYKKEHDGLEKKIKETINEVTNPEVAETFIDITIKLLRRLADIDVQVTEIHKNSDRIAPYLWNVYQIFKGDFNGTYVISVSDSVLIKIATYIAQEKIWEVDDFAKDAVKEFINVVVGNSVSKLSQSNIKLSLEPPKIVTSMGRIEIIDEQSETLGLKLSSPEHELHMAIVYKRN